MVATAKVFSYVIEETGWYSVGLIFSGMGKRQVGIAWDRFSAAFGIEQVGIAWD